MNKKMKRSSDEQWRVLTGEFEAEMGHSEWKALSDRLDRHERRKRMVLGWGTFCLAAGLLLTGWLMLPDEATELKKCSPTFVTEGFCYFARRNDQFPKGR